MAKTEAAETGPHASGARWVFRHPATIRIAHWVNVVCLAVLLLSGLQIFNAHPALYWGHVSTFDTPLVAMTATETEPPRGVTTAFGRSFDTTGVLGASKDADGEIVGRGFPSWATLPSYQSLAEGRSWHFFFAWLFVLNGLVYLAYGLASGQLKRRLVPTGGQLRHIGASIVEHLRFRFPKGEEATRYNVLQKLTYLVVVLGLLPLQLLAGLALSPGFNAAAPWVIDLFGGRQSARTIHFVLASLLVLFVLVHVAMVVLSGFWNNVRGMLTGWFSIERTTASGDQA